DLLTKGYLWLPLSLKSEFPDVKLMQWTPADAFRPTTINMGQNPGLILVRDGTLVGTVVNGVWNKSE
ncbi:MAG TPA: hypothetical protein P5275_20905, partial [Saprospiraceae bacterium]|nr:hypothetical protein [Saprospiraceae bacterium]